MKYVVTYTLVNDDVSSAFALDSYHEAINYVNDCVRQVSKAVISMKKIRDNHYLLSLKNGQNFRIVIQEYSNAEVRYAVTCRKNSFITNKEGFTNRQEAVDYAHKILDDLDFEPELNEDVFGNWVINDSTRQLDVQIVVSLLILSNNNNPGDYELLGIGVDASTSDIKKAFHKLANKYHPDKGGDPKKFEQIHSAYKRILDGQASGANRRTIVVDYPCVDMHAFFKGAKTGELFGRGAHNGQSADSKELDSEGVAGSMIVLGVLLFLLGKFLLAYSGVGVLVIILGVNLFLIGISALLEDN